MIHYAITKMFVFIKQVPKASCDYVCCACSISLTYIGSDTMSADCVGPVSQAN